MQYNALMKKLDAIEKNGKAPSVKFKQQEIYNINRKFHKTKHEYQIKHQIITNE